MKDRKAEGKYDYCGSCGPRKLKEFRFFRPETFSVSVFQWVRGRAGLLKKAKSVYRVKGAVSDSEKVYARAEKLCDLFDTGVIMSQKSETIR